MPSSALRLRHLALAHSIECAAELVEDLCWLEDGCHESHYRFRLRFADVEKAKASFLLLFLLALRKVEGVSGFCSLSAEEEASGMYVGMSPVISKSTSRE